MVKNEVGAVKRVHITKVRKLFRVSFWGIDRVSIYTVTFTIPLTNSSPLK